MPTRSGHGYSVRSKLVLLICVCSGASWSCKGDAPTAPSGTSGTTAGSLFDQAYEFPILEEKETSVAPGSTATFFVQVFPPLNASVALLVDWDDPAQDVDFRVFEPYTAPDRSPCDNAEPPPYDGGGCTLLFSVETDEKPKLLIEEPPPEGDSGWTVILRNRGSRPVQVSTTALSSAVPVATPTSMSGGWLLLSEITRPCDGIPSRADEAEFQQRGNSLSITVRGIEGTLTGSVTSSGAFSFGGAIVEDGVRTTVDARGQLNSLGLIDGTVTESFSSCTHTATFTGTRVLLPR